MDRFLKWKLPSGSAAGDEDGVADDETGEDPDNEDDSSVRLKGRVDASDLGEVVRTR